MSSKIVLQSSAGKNFNVDLKVANKSLAIRTMLEALDVGDEDDKENVDVNTVNNDPVPLPNVDAKTLKLVLEWCERHRDDKEADEEEEEEEYEDKSHQVFPQWDKDWIKNMDTGVLFELILAVNYLEIKLLMDLCCEKVASLIRGKTAKEIRETFGITEEDLEMGDAEEVKEDEVKQEDAQVKEEEDKQKDAEPTAESLGNPTSQDN